MKNLLPLVALLGGCASAPPAGNYVACISSIGPAPVAARYADGRDEAIVLMARALAGTESTPQRDCGRVREAYYRNHSDVVRNIGGIVKLPLSILSGGWSASRIADAGGTTSVRNNASGGSTAAGRNVADDHSTSQIIDDINVDDSASFEFGL